MHLTKLMALPVHLISLKLVNQNWFLNDDSPSFSFRHPFTKTTGFLTVWIRITVKQVKY